jgi:hypothetical protein
LVRRSITAVPVDRPAGELLAFDDLAQSGLFAVALGLVVD